MQTNELDSNEWNQICSDTVNQMAEYTKKYISPISMVISEEEGQHLGTGSYFEIGSEKYIITNRHVAKYLKTNSLTHKFLNDDRILRLTNPAYSIPAPIDIATSMISTKSWELFEHGSSAIPSHKFAKKHDPFQHELLFFAGFSGIRSKFFFNYLFTPGTPYLTQECPFPADVDGGDPKYHFALPYKPDLATSVDNSSSLPDPHGFSGSLVWDTKRVLCLQSGITWSPNMAEVTGIVWGWPSSQACILATKAEYIKLKINDDNA